MRNHILVGFDPEPCSEVNEQPVFLAAEDGPHEGNIFMTHAEAVKLAETLRHQYPRVKYVIMTASPVTG